jgi:hypothetical protein
MANDTFKPLAPLRVRVNSSGAAVGLVDQNGAAISFGAGDMLAANNLSDVASAATARTNLGLAIGTNVQAWDADLDNLASNGNTAAGLAMLSAANAAAQVALLPLPVVFQVACSDRSTALSTGTNVASFRAPFAFTLTAVRSMVDTASSSGLVTVDINEGGTSVLGASKLSIDANEKTSTTAATPTSISDTAIADDAELTFDIDSAGTGAKGLLVTLIGTKP